MTVTKEEEEKKETAPAEEVAIKVEGSESSPPAVCETKEDPFSLKVKDEYIANSRPASLLPLPSEDSTPASDENSGKKSKKKRPRDARIEDGSKVCHRIVRGEECPFGDSCKFSHDVKEFLANRPPDIDEVEGGCPIFHLHGFCPYGVQCRIAKSHINMATGENLRKEPEKPPPPPVMNILPKDVQRQLWKNKFPFKQKRHFEKKGPKAAEATETSTESKTDMSPLPTKRKLIDFSKKIYVGKFVVCTKVIENEEMLDSHVLHLSRCTLMCSSTAPLTTVGNLPFRRIMKRYGADITCGEMALATNLLQGQASEWALLKRHPDEDIFGAQLAAGFPDQFTRIAEVIEATMNVDFVDLNLGCPLDLLCNKGSGAALMRRDNNLKGALQGMAKVLSCPITIKMRTGWDINKPFAHELVPKIQSWGFGDSVAAIMVHGRSRLQRYSKEADWDYVNKVSLSQSPELPVLPLIGNGDIFSYTDYEEKVAREGVSSCAMLARGALIKPWLPTEIKERRHWDISATERLDMLKDFVKFGLEHWGTDQHGVNNCRRFLLEWLSFLHRYVPVGLLEVLPQQMNQRPPLYMCGRNDLETLFLSPHASDWIKISEMLLGPVPEGFLFEPKHKAKAYSG
eukprot:scaffold425_cov175-Amphora_coffeaeformis.AAC.23